MRDVGIHTGGAVANTGLAMKLLGADVSLMGKIGADHFGDMLMLVNMNEILLPAKEKRYGVGFFNAEKFSEINEKSGNIDNPINICYYQNRIVSLV